MQGPNKSYRLSELSELLRGALQGDESLTIDGLCTLEDAKPNHLCFIRTLSTDALARALSLLPPHAAAIVSADLFRATPVDSSVSVILVNDPYPAFLDLVPLFSPEARPREGIHQSAVIDPSALVGTGASIGAHCTIGARVRIGPNAIMYPNVTIYDDVTIGESATLHSGTSIRSGSLIGDRVTIHNHVVIGADGFGYIPDPTRGLRKVPQIGNVKIESDVEIGAQTCIDRGAFGSTTIGRGTKIDNLVQIGHNVSIGAHCIVCGQAAIGGSTKISDGVVVGGAASIADHLEIVSGVRLGGRAGVTASIMEAGDYMGFPAVKASEWRRQQVRLRRVARAKKDRGET